MVEKEKINISWEELHKLTLEVGKQINNNFKPDVLIGLVRGGLVPARILSSFLNNPRLYCMKIEFYDKDDNPTKKPNITQELNVHLENLNVLVIDEVCDTGSTLKTTLEYLKKFNPKDIKTAVIHLKPHSIFKPDFHADTTDKWIIYPWENP